MKKIMWIITHTIAAAIAFLFIPVVSLIVPPDVGMKSTFQSWKEHAFSWNKSFGGLDEPFEVHNEKS